MADAIAVNKADGANRKCRKRESHIECLRLYPAPDSGWPKVVTCSTSEYRHQEIWKIIMDYVDFANQQVLLSRKRQAVVTHDTIMNSLEVYNNPEIKSLNLTLNNYIMEPLHHIRQL